MRLVGTMKMATKTASAGICSRCCTRFSRRLCVVGVLEIHACAILLVISATPSWAAASKSPAFGHGLLLDDPMRWLSSQHIPKERRLCIDAKEIDRRC